MIGSAPHKAAPCKMFSPTPPAPKIATLCPGRTCGGIHGRSHAGRNGATHQRRHLQRNIFADGHATLFAYHHILGKDSPIRKRCKPASPRQLNAAGSIVLRASPSTSGEYLLQTRGSDHSDNRAHSPQSGSETQGRHDRLACTRCDALADGFDDACAFVTEDHRCRKGSLVQPPGASRCGRCRSPPS